MRRADIGDHGKGPGAIARGGGISGLGARNCAVPGYARIRGCRAAAQVRFAAALQSTREKISVSTGVDGVTGPVTPSTLSRLQRPGEMPLQHRARNRVGLLQIDAPVF